MKKPDKLPEGGNCGDGYLPLVLRLLSDVEKYGGCRACRHSTGADECLLGGCEGCTPRSRFEYCGLAAGEPEKKKGDKK